jgi:hypothetical protein
MLADSKITLNASTAGGLTVPGAMTLGDTYTIGLKTCSTNQVLQYSGTAWACASVGTGTITGVTAGTDLTGGGTTGTVTLNLNTTKVPLLATANTFTANQTVDGTLTATGTVTAGSLSAATASIISTNAVPVQITSNVADATTTYSQASASTGEGWGVEGETDSSDPAAYGVFGLANNGSGNPIGVYGLGAASSSATGVFGQNQTESATGTAFSDFYVGSGVWGDGGASGPYGVIGTADTGVAGFFANSSTKFSIFIQNAGSGDPFVAGYGADVGVVNDWCEIDGSGDLSCTGTISPIVPIDGGKRIVGVSAIESPQNWFEDFGSGQLAGGVAIVTLDPDFIQTVNTEIDYKVFPVPNGDCKGLFVTHKTPTSFEVRELGGGSSSVAFDYRITAVRKNYEKVRFADHTHGLDGHKRMLAHAHATGATKQQSHMPTKKLSPARPLIPVKAVK